MTDNPTKDRYPMIHSRLGRMLGRDRKGLAHISQDKTKLWLEIYSLIQDFEASLDDVPLDPCADERARLEAQVERLIEENRILSYQLAGQARTVAAAQLVCKAWTDAGLNPIYHQKSQGWVRAHWPTLSKAIDRLGTLTGTVTA